MNKNGNVYLGDCFDGTVFLVYEHDKKLLKIVPRNENALYTMLTEIYGKNPGYLNLDQDQLTHIVNSMGEKAPEGFRIEPFEVMSLNDHLGQLSLIIAEESPQFVVEKLEIDYFKYQLNTEYVTRVFSGLAYGLSIPVFADEQTCLTSNRPVKSVCTSTKHEPLTEREIEDIVYELKAKFSKSNFSSFEDVKDMINKKLKDTGNTYEYPSGQLVALVNKIFFMV
ncbi:hypothetical protein [Vibrio vulnificus]|uniref:hypothetical protein n=1 Tax=Vibrio vulnificus TaxID=672 RepID=UPI0032420AA8